MGKVISINKNKKQVEKVDFERLFEETANRRKSFEDNREKMRQSLKTINDLMQELKNYGKKS